MLITEDNVFRHRRDTYCLHLQTQWGIYRLANWQGTLTCSRPSRGNWMHVSADPGLIILHDGSAPRSGPLGDFIDRIPDDVRRIAGRFRHLQLTALRLLRYDSRALDLAADLPALFWLICGAAAGDDRMIPGMALAASKKRGDILRMFFGEQTRLTPRVLRKIRLSRFDRDEFEGMRKVLNAESKGTRILHWPFFAPDAVCRAYNRMGRLVLPHKVVMSCIGDAIDARQMDLLVVLHEDTRRMFRLLRNGEDGRSFAEIERTWANRADLVRYHDRLVREMTARVTEEYPLPFPPPVLPGCPDIIPITDSAGLYREGRDMMHCVYAYLDQVLCGELSIYQVLRPERATLAVHRGYASRILECSLFGNAEPSLETLSVVREWVERRGRPSTDL